MQAKMSEKNFLQTETEEKNILAEGNLPFKVKCQESFMYNTVNCKDSKFRPKCPKIAFLRL